MPTEPELLAAARAALAALPRAAGELWLVACSGGPDSLALLAAAAALAPELGVRLAAVYVDHGLRPAAAAEAEQVGRLAAALGVESLVRRVDTRGRARRERRSVMEAARLERYDALAAAAAELGATRVLVGHTADDQVETLVMRLLRGTGLRGLAGIPAQRDRYVRPLLSVRRAAIEDFLAARGLDPVRDPSNADRRFLRPFVRHDLLPLLRREVPSLDAVLLALQGRARAACATLDAWLGAGEGGDLAVPELIAAPPPLREARLVRAFQRAGGAGLCACHLAALDDLLATTAGTRTLDLPGGLRAERRYAALRFCRTKTGPEATPVTVPGPGRYRLLDHEFTVGCGPAAAGEAADGDPFRACFDAAVVGFPLTLRPPRPGDRLRPRGFGHRRKLSDLLGEAHVPAPERRRLPVLADETEVLLVPGVRASERGRPGPRTRDLLWVRVRPHGRAQPE